MNLHDLAHLVISALFRATFGVLLTEAIRRVFQPQPQPQPQSQPPALPSKPRARESVHPPKAVRQGAQRRRVRRS